MIHADGKITVLGHEVTKTWLPLPEGCTIRHATLSVTIDKRVYAIGRAFVAKQFSVNEEELRVELPGMLEKIAHKIRQLAGDPLYANRV